MGSKGNGDGQFQQPHGIVVNSSGYVHIADTANKRIQVFNPDRTYVTQWGVCGVGTTSMCQPMDLAIDSSDNVYVAESNDGMIEVFSLNGTYLTQMGSKGNGDGQFQQPHGIVVNSSGYVHIADTANIRIQVFSTSLPTKFNWHKKDGVNWMSPVKNQGIWGSCWAFATVGKTEAIYNIEQGELKNIDLSEWDLHWQINHGVDMGNSIVWADSFMYNPGVVEESCNPFDWNDSDIKAQSIIPWNRCADFTSHLWKIDNYHYLTHPSIRGLDYIKQKIMEKPVTVIISPWSKNWLGEETNHAVILMGWNDEEKIWYYKNSWGKSWGVEGYGALPYSESQKISIMDWSSGVHRVGG